MEQMKSEQLRAEILSKVREYYHLAHAPQQQAPFVPGESQIHYGGRVFDQDELLNLVDASLEFWLTYGRYSRQFEQQLAEYLGVPFV
ncbi:MAG: lipopolysaccharide biosynthesis protein RfbH, partial [Lentisphaerae bacterium]|nr:lipopolysaccharide biosynthesis protein RfbH [Lentisphaerota bacterium]